MSIGGEQLEQTEPVDSETEPAENSSTVLPDLLQSPIADSVQTTSQSEQAAENLNTPRHSVSGGNVSTPTSGSSSEPMRFRNLNEIYEDTFEIELQYSETELEDSDVEVLLVDSQEPTCYREVADHQDWINAMEKEMESIEKNRAWELVKLPVGKKLIGLKWVYKLKKNSEGAVVKHKARLVAKGYVQKHGVDFEEVFAPVARLDTVRFFLALAANLGWKVHHLDVKSAFLH